MTSGSDCTYLILVFLMIQIQFFSQPTYGRRRIPAKVISTERLHLTGVPAGGGASSAASWVDPDWLSSTASSSSNRTNIPMAAQSLPSAQHVQCKITPLHRCGVPRTAMLSQQGRSTIDAAASRYSSLSYRNIQCYPSLTRIFSFANTSITIRRVAEENTTRRLDTSHTHNPTDMQR